MMISRPKYSTITMIAARIAVATALSRAISSSGVRALNGCLITIHLYAGKTADYLTFAFLVASDGISLETSSIADMTELRFEQLMRVDGTWFDRVSRMGEWVRFLPSDRPNHTVRQPDPSFVMTGSQVRVLFAAPLLSSS